MCYQKAIINCNHATQPIIIINLVPHVLHRRSCRLSSPHLDAVLLLKGPSSRPVNNKWKAKGKHMQNDEAATNQRSSSSSSSGAAACICDASASASLCPSNATENVYVHFTEAPSGRTRNRNQFLARSIILS